ncbi:MAG: DUF3618 domain-containing protein [Acetobacteraceae bacterium]
MQTTTDDPDAIERDLNSTRARLDSRLSELASRLSPGQILDEGLDLLRTREGVDFTRNLSGAVRERPIPVALVGVGLAWLMATPRPAGPTHIYSSRPADPRLGQPRVRPYEDALAARAWEAGRGVTRTSDETDSSYRTRVTEARGKVLGIVRAAQDTAESYADRVHDALFAARDAVSDAVGGAAETVGTVGGRLGDAMQGASDRVAASAHDLRDQGQRLSDAASGGLRRARDNGTGIIGELAAAIGENPVLLGAFGLAAGALLGALLPPTQMERDYFGEAAHDARDAIEGVVRDATDRGAEVAQAAMDAGRKTVQDITEHASKLGGAAADAASEVAGQVQRHASELGGTASQAARSVAGQATPTATPR